MKYRGWTVIDDPMYHRLIKENIDFVNNDVKEMTKIINTYVSNKSVAIDVCLLYTSDAADE